MRFRRTKVAVAAFGLALGMAACGEAGDDDEGETLTGEEVDCADFEGEVASLCEAGTITIGVKYDQPGLGFQSAGSDVPTGFDVEVAKLLAADLGIDTEDIEWVETISDNREPFLQEGRVDLVLATYSITEERRALVGQAGPYMLTGQQILVLEDSDVTGIEDLQGEEVCAALGSTSLERIDENGMTGVGFDSYSECVEKVLDGSVPAMSTDGSILLGYAAEHPGELKVVGEEFSEERIGVGYSIDAPEMCEFINESLQESFDDGTWADAFEATLGKAGAETPEPPALDACQ